MVKIKKTSKHIRKLKKKVRRISGKCYGNLVTITKRCYENCRKIL